MKKLTKQDKLTLLFFSFGFALFAFVPAVEKDLLKIILPLSFYMYWTVYFLAIFLVFYLYSFFKKRAFLYKYNKEKKILSSLKLLYIGGLVGLLVNILNIYVIGIIQMIFNF